ncbi:MAG TPA: 2OG-Fe(II) oxygenase family protein [Steroidobacteraceae bacterium]|nr:2OG-Fe(II) oxygenase family protein [Steroidobacteraceae bacterium]
MANGSSPDRASVIPLIDVGALFEADPAAWLIPDRALAEAARDTGFACIRGMSSDVPLERAARARMLTIFGLDSVERHRLYRRKFAPENRNIYRGWFPLQPGNLTSKEGIDLGGDIAHGLGVTSARDPLRERTPLPEDNRIPGWRDAVATYYRAMERIAGMLMRSLARTLGLPAEYFDEAFRGGLSTLRLIRYPPRSNAELAAVPEAAISDGRSPLRHVVGAPHTDSGFVTLLAQDGVAGLQARSRDGGWIDVPPVEGSLVVNFGQVLEQWSSGRIRATEHRVLSAGVERYSIPFFYEARAETTIAPLPIDPPDRFAPFQYGDFLWKRMTSFVEFRGMEGERARTDR